MIRINIRQYKKHPLNRPYPATYLMWSSMDPVQQDALRKWAVDTNEALVQFGKEVGGAVCSAFRKVFERETE